MVVYYLLEKPFLNVPFGGLLSFCCFALPPPVLLWPFIYPLRGYATACLPFFTPEGGVRCPFVLPQRGNAKPEGVRQRTSPLGQQKGQNRRGTNSERTTTYYIEQTRGNI